MEAFLDPVNRRRQGIKWGLVAYTTAMFSFVTVYTAISLHIQSISYIDNRGFSGNEDVGAPGPLGYQTLVFSEPINIVPNTMFLLNNWLADGLLVSSGSNLVAHVFNVAVVPALPLLHYLRQEPLGPRLPLPGVPRLFWYVLWSPWANGSALG